MTTSSPEKSLRVLFSIRNFWYLKYYESVFRLLAERGHLVHVVADRGDGDKFTDWTRAMERLARELANVTFSWARDRQRDPWVDLHYWVREGLEQVRFLEPQFDRAPVLRRRAMGSFFERLSMWPRPLSRAAGAVISRTLQLVDTALANPVHVETLLRDHAPDVVVVTPLVALGSYQADVIVAGQRVGVPTAVAVTSWDHLSSKARIRVAPDALFVWNDRQKGEAWDYHRIPAHRIVVTGAQCFDQWFDRSPTRSREEFCSHLGLPPERPLVFYVGSSLFWDSPNEAEFTKRWIEALRASPHPTLRDASILIRPHPKRGYEWDDVDLSGYDRVVVWPPRGQPPLDAESKAVYFDSLYHCAAIVGLNTSAQIEGGLIGRPVYTILLPEFWDNQEGTLHFQYLLNEGGGLLHGARSLDEHFRQLAAGLEDPRGAAARNRSFVETFVRPRGLTTSATEVFVSELEQLARRRPTPRGRPVWASALRWTLRPAAQFVTGTAPRKWIPRTEERSDPEHYPVPAWAWSMRKISRPLAPLAPSLLGSRGGWREADIQHKARLMEAHRAAKRGARRAQAAAERAARVAVRAADKARQASNGARGSR